LASVHFVSPGAASHCTQTHSIDFSRNASDACSALSRHAFQLALAPRPPEKYENAFDVWEPHSALIHSWPNSSAFFANGHTLIRNNINKIAERFVWSAAQTTTHFMSPGTKSSAVPGIVAAAADAFFPMRE
jgi:hypothetical protein